MLWQLLSLWLWAHPTVVGATFFSYGNTWQADLPSAKLVRAQHNGRELFYIDRGGRLHLREHDPAVIACAWVRTLSSSVPCRP